MAQDTSTVSGKNKVKPMEGMITVELKQLRFFAHHGLYAEEKKTGNEFEVNLSVFYLPNQGTVTDISETINYALLYELVKNEMARPTGLLETVTMNIAAKIRTTFPLTKRISISITKLHPPILNFTGSVCVCFDKEY
jgi:7,8-dihydroneopterin aldolase/epimerase/oxygenase